MIDWNFLSINALDEANDARLEGRSRSVGNKKENGLFPAEITRVESAGIYECTIINSDGSYGAVFPHVFCTEIYSVGAKVNLYFDKTSPIPKIISSSGGSGGEIFVVIGNLPFAV
jgi:hypothetical protein